MIDTHAHLNHPQLVKKVAEIIKESQRVGVNQIIVVGSNLADSKLAVELASRWPKILFAAIGVHPQSKENPRLIQQQFNQLITSHRQQIVAIGECGLDFGPAEPNTVWCPPQQQKKIFVTQLKLARKFRLPVIIHARQASDEVIEILQQLGDLKAGGVFHCYSGGRKRIEKILNLGKRWYFGVAGNLTYDSGLVNVVAQIPQNRILLETDSPFLAPIPWRGKTNTPANLPFIAQKLAQIWQTSLQKVTQITTQNARQLFSLTQTKMRNRQPPSL